jgi:hypothetical protein
MFRENKLEKVEGLYVLPSNRGGAVNLVVGSKTFRLAEFDDFDEAVDFALSVAENNADTKVFIVE